MKKIVLGLIVFCGFYSCSKDDQSNDQLVNDPYLLQAEIIFEVSTFVNGSSNHQIIARFRDEDNEYISLKGGSISINNFNMPLYNETQSNLPYYLMNDAQIPIEENKEYVAAVSLADGNTYNSRIKTHEAFLTSFEVPDFYYPDSTTCVRWMPVQSDVNAYIEITVHYEDHTINETLQLNDGSNGSYCFPEDYFEQREGISSIYLTLYTIKKGAIHPAFRDESTIKCVNSITKKLMPHQAF